MTDTDWDSRLRRTRAEAAAFHPFLGRWRGRGTAHGEPVEGTLEAAALLDGTFIEVRESSADHEDRTIYRFEPEDASLRVLHLLAGATLREYAVERFEGGLVWVTPPGEPTVEWFFGADELRCDVTWPGEPAPDVSMVWRRE